MRRLITLTVNGEEQRLEVKPNAVLLDVLREDLGLKGTKEGCGVGACGACTVLLNGRALSSCLVLAVEADGQAVTTIEGVSTNGHLTPLQQAFVDHGAVQCGFCTPGLILSATALLAATPRPTTDEVRRAIAGNLCRCTGYVKVVDAVRHVAQAAEARAHA
jgi:carbon-monoxide dehydrogenase small subunit